MISIPERLIEVFTEKRPIPHKLEIRPTKRCNLNCLHCWRRGHEGKWDYGDEIPPERLIEIIREGAALGVENVELVGGGEPTFDRRAAMDYFHEIKRNGMFGDLVTNGTLFTEEMVREMVEMSWDRIMFSIDGADAATHDSLRGKTGAFKRAVENIRLFTSWKRRRGVEKPLIGMVPVLTNRNHTQFSDFIELAHRIGAYHVGFKPLVIEHRFGEPLKIRGQQLEEMNRHIEEAIPLAEKYAIDTNLRSIIHRPGNEVVQKSASLMELYENEVMETRELLSRAMETSAAALVPQYPKQIYRDFSRFIQIPCFIPWHHLTISPEGLAVPCTGGGKLEPKPSVRETPLKEVLCCDAFTEFREALAVGKMPALCTGCCVGLFLDNRRHREKLKQLGMAMLRHG